MEELFGELHEQEENGLFGNEHRRQYDAQQDQLNIPVVSDVDKIFELAELLADEAFGEKGLIAYSQRQELTSKFNEILVKNLTLYDVVGRSEQLICPECENPYPHSHTDGSYSCEDCGHKWAN